MKLRVKYCGGCNPRFDRMRLVTELQQTYSEAEFVFQDVPDADAAIVVCGCNAACAEVSDCVGAEGRFVLWSPSALGELHTFLDRIK